MSGRVTSPTDRGKRIARQISPRNRAFCACSAGFWSRSGTSASSTLGSRCQLRSYHGVIDPAPSSCQSSLAVACRRLRPVCCVRARCATGVAPRQERRGAWPAVGTKASDAAPRPGGMPEMEVGIVITVLTVEAALQDTCAVFRERAGRGDITPAERDLLIDGAILLAMRAVDDLSARAALTRPRAGRERRGRTGRAARTAPGRSSRLKVARTLLMVVFAAAARILPQVRAEMRAARVGLLAGSRVVPTARGPVELAEEGDGPPVVGGSTRTRAGRPGDGFRAQRRG